MDSSEHTMFVVESRPDGFVLNEDYACDPRGEIGIFADFPAAQGARAAPVGSEVLVRYWGSYAAGYVRFGTPAGAILWEGGRVTDYLDTASRFEAVWVPDAQLCTPDFLPADDPCGCEIRAPLHATVATDVGAVELAQGDEAAVTIDGLPCVAVVPGAFDLRALPCIDDGETGNYLRAYVAAAFDPPEPTLDPPEPADDPCPPDEPAEGRGCTTAGDLQCAYEDAGSSRTFTCRGCFWSLVGEGPMERCEEQ